MFSNENYHVLLYFGTLFKVAAVEVDKAIVADNY